ncbi:MAG: hypothetical protein FWC73_06025 [Defluviitaleaceae bacterium]|nr:hypothetical protein [Defluviitaleaceae bacterium]
MTQPARWITFGIIILALISIALGVTRCISNRNDGHITIEFYNDWGGHQTGVGTGWFAHMVDYHFNMTINYLGSPNMEELFQERRAAGDLGDLIIIGTQRLRQTIHDELLMDITDFVGMQMPNYNTFFPGAVARARELSLADRIYALPIQVSTQSATTPRIAGLVPHHGAFMRQDAYMAIGAPDIFTLEDLLPVLFDMQQAFPYTDSGLRTYGFSLYTGPEDDTILHTAAAFAQLYSGMDRFSTTSFIDHSNQRLESFLDINGIYIRALKLYFDANQMGILDPDSRHQSWNDLWGKFEHGAVMFSWWSWLGAETFNTTGRANQGVGYNFIPITNQRIFHENRINPVGPNHTDLVIAVGANAQEPERIIEFIDWLASPEGHQTVVAGPEGLTWEMIGDMPVLTDFGVAAGVQTGTFSNVDVPENWGDGTFVQGGWHGNITVPMSGFGREINPATGYPFNPRLWPASGNTGVSWLDFVWTDRFGHNTPLDFVLDNNIISAPPTTDFVKPADPPHIAQMRNEIRPVVLDASWRMIFASTESEFFDIWIEMYDEAIALGWNEVFEYDNDMAQQLFAAQRAAR